MDKHAFINVRNYDQKYFLWSMLAALYQAMNNPNCVNNYIEHVNKISTEVLEFLIPLNQIIKFEHKNNIDVFVYERKQIFPLCINKFKNEIQISLLLVSNGENTPYCCIKSMNRFLINLTKYNRKSCYWNVCLKRFSSEIVLNKHIEICQKHDTQRIELPASENKWLQFKSIYV